MDEIVDFKNYSNDKLLEMTKILSANHEKIKWEIITLNEMINNIQKEYVAIIEELKSRV